jgi:hypothetical protein
MSLQCNQPALACLDGLGIILAIFILAQPEISVSKAQNTTLCHLYNMLE